MIQKLRNYFRQQRKELFLEFCKDMGRPIRILDLGGTASFWLSCYGYKCSDFFVTLINNHHIDKTNKDYDGSISWIKEINADAGNFSAWNANSIDLIFSNSFLEHLESIEKQKTIARNIEKTKLPYFLQTPNKYCFVDPHFPSLIVPYFACYSKSVQAWLLTLNKMGSGSKSPSLEAAHLRLRYYNPLATRDVKSLFPSGNIKKETTFGICRSIIVCHK